MFRSYFKEISDEAFQQAVERGCLYISDDGTKIECFDNMPQSKAITSLLNDEDAEKRQYAQLHCALAMLNEKHRSSGSKPIQPIERLVHELHDHHNNRSIDFHLPSHFNRILLKKNLQLLKVIFKDLDIKLLSLKSYDFSEWTTENIDVLSEMLAVAKISQLGWSPFHIPEDLHAEKIRLIQGKIPSIMLYSDSTPPNTVRYLSAFKAFMRIQTIKKVEFENYNLISEIFRDILDALHQSAIANIKFGYITGFTRSSIYTTLPLHNRLDINVLPKLCEYIRTKVKSLDLSSSSSIWERSYVESETYYVKNTTIAKEINSAIANSQVEALYLDATMFGDPLDSTSIAGLFEAIQKCKSLTKLVLKEVNYFKQADYEIFFLLLDETVYLSLTSLHIESDIVLAMLEPRLTKFLNILKNPKLEELTFGHIKWSDEKWEIFFNALKKSKIKKLRVPSVRDFSEDMNYADITKAKELWIKFCEAIACCDLQEIKIDDPNNELICFIEGEMLEALLKAVNCNVNITEIQVNDCPLKKVGRFEEITDALTRNRELVNTCQALDNFSFKDKDDAEAENLVKDLSQNAIALYGARKTNKGGVAQVALSEMLQPAIVRFLQKLLNEKSWQVKRLLRLLSANTDAVKQLYFNYANMLWEKVALMTRAEDIVNLLFTTTQYFFDVSGELVQFKAEGLFIDYMLIKALGLKQPPEMTPQLRLAFWQYLMLKQFVKGFNMGVPKTEDDIKKINKLWINIWMLHAEPQKPFSKQQARALRYTQALFELCCMEQKIKQQLSTPGTVSAARKVFLLLLSDYLNSYKQIKLISAQHQALLDRLAIRVSGNTMLSIETKEQRLFCFELILLNEWKENNKNELPNTAAFYQLPHKELVKKVMSEVKALIDGGATFIRPLCDYIEALSRQIIDDSKELAQRIDLANLTMCNSISPLKL